MTDSFCTGCGMALPETGRFCAACGTPRASVSSPEDVTGISDADVLTTPAAPTDATPPDAQDDPPADARPRPRSYAALGAVALASATTVVLTSGLAGLW